MRGVIYGASANKKKNIYIYIYIYIYIGLYIHTGFPWNGLIGLNLFYWITLQKAKLCYVDEGTGFRSAPQRMQYAA